MRKIILFFLVIINMLPAVLHAQTRVISGTVRDAGGVLPGASVVEKGMPENGTVTDGNGKFTLTLKGTSNTVVSNFIGYTPREVVIGARTTGIDITLISNNQGLDEVVVVAYGKSSRITNTGAVSTISAADIRTVPTANVQNALSGRMPGFFSQQVSGQPGKDASDFYIRGVSSLNPDGNRPLIIVDDIEYTYDQLQQINVNEIETISILKDASTTAIYGIKGANGVLVVTTRRGKSGKPQVNLRTEAGLQSPTRTPKFLNSYDAALLVNQAELNDDPSRVLASKGQVLPKGVLPLSFTKDDLELFKNGTDPYGHPDVNWYDAIFDKFTYQANTNLDISGGTDQLRYFISGGALSQNGLAKTFADPRGKTNTQYDFQRYNFRSNLDLKANKTLDLRLDITTRFSNINSPRISSASALSEVYDFSRITPFTAPFLNPDGSYAYATSKFNPGQLPTLNARLATGGYDNTRRTDYNVLFNATQRLDAITNGLSVTGRVAFASTEQFTKSAGNYGAIPTYFYNSTTKTTVKNPNGSYVFPSIYYAGNINIYTTNVNVQLFGNYDRTFGNKHHVTGLVLASQSAQTYSANDNTFPPLSADRVAVPAKARGLSLQAEYEYAGKYLFKINGAYNGTDRFAAKNRYGWFPSISAGYNISKEEFFKKALPMFGLFKIRGSFGLVGSDAAPGNKYIYLQTYSNGNGYNFGTSSYDIATYREGSQSNFNVVWEKQREADIGLDINMLKDNALSISVDYFYNVRYDQLIEPKNIPLILGVGLPSVNVGRVRNMGFDGQIGYRFNVNKVQMGTNFVFSYAKNKVLFKSEAQPAYPHLAETGWPIDQPFGYQFEGYYTQADIAAIKAGNKSVPVPDSNYPVQAGDLKYKDLNGDGIISVFDKSAIGNAPLATTNLGLNLTASYKGFNISVLFQGSFNYSYIITGTGIEPFQSQFQPIHQQAWTPATAATAQFPRLTQYATTVNSPKAYPSNYWLVDARYVRLKTVDMGYQFPSRMLPFNLNNARIYLSAYNLFTWNNFNRYQADPEVKTNTAGDAYINQRVVNLGIQLGF